MPPRKRSVKTKVPLGKCMDCVYCSNPHSMSLAGVPTLASCEFEVWGVLYQRPCRNGHFQKR